MHNYSGPPVYLPRAEVPRRLALPGPVWTGAPSSDDAAGPGMMFVTRGSGFYPHLSTPDPLFHPPAPLALV